ncbi:MAG TPA: O-fucosyltransferase family protein [Pyrinomonadaceae bacterium]|nr:O-fucosyltransferase family protein [Pyrinomonadaceae bacterium]
MKYLFYNNYCTGRSGLSNGIMSIELGVVLAYLTDRVLVIEGNVSPPANLVSYGDRVSNRHPSKITDLLDVPVPFLALEQIDLSTLSRRELFDESLLDSVFYYPANLETDTPDFEFFRQGRPYKFTYPDDYREVEVLALSGGVEYGKARHKMNNLGFYSTLFYLGEEWKPQVKNLLGRMRPKKHLADFAGRVAASLGRFNAVHLRRGDFKRTVGKSVLLRRPSEVIERLDHNFARSERLLILTDESEDAFVKEIQMAYRDHVVLDRFILDEFGQEFLDLPQHDSVALAFLSQLVAAESEDFVGTMTSTYTSLIQRQRGNRGRDERFKFLWNEIPARDIELLAGTTPANEEVPLYPNGEMVEQYAGPYSWNRYCPRIDTGWMREWPESFLLP